MIDIIALFVIGFIAVMYYLTHRDQGCDNESGWHEYGQWQ